VVDDDIARREPRQELARTVQSCRLVGCPQGRTDVARSQTRVRSFLADPGGKIHEVPEAARHKDIRTTELHEAREERLKILMGKVAMRSA
jgi:hypothetical protein